MFPREKVFKSSDAGAGARFGDLAVATVALLLATLVPTVSADASLCPGGAELMGLPLDMFDMSSIRAGTFPPAQGTVTAAQLSSYTINTVAVEPTTLRVYASARLDVTGTTSAGSSVSYNEDALIGVPSFATGDNTAVLMTALAPGPEPAALASVSPNLVQSSSASSGTLLRNIVMASAYRSAGTAYGFLRIKALLFTDTELLLVTQQDILVLGRTELAADATGATVAVKSVPPLPGADGYKYFDGSDGYIRWFDWTALAWAPAQDRLYAATSTTGWYGSGSSFSTFPLGSVLYAFKRGSSWSTLPVQLTLTPPALPVFVSMCDVRSMAYVPPPAGGSGGRLLMVCAGTTSGGIGLLATSLSASTGETSTYSLIAGRSGSDGPEPDDGVTALGASLSGLDRSMVSLDAAGLTGAFLLTGSTRSRVLWPNGTLGTIIAADEVTSSAPIVVGIQLPLPAAGSSGTLTSIMTPAGIIPCRGPRTACPVGQICAVAPMPREPALLACPRRSLCPAGTLAFTPLAAGSTSKRLVGVQSCPSGSICVENATAPAVCTAGYQCIQDDSRDIIEPCSRKKYCPRGTAIGMQGTCRSGALCVGSAVDRFGRPTGGLCPAGSMCDQLETGDVQMPCVAGAWCPAGTKAYSDLSMSSPWDHSPCLAAAQLPVNFCRDFPESANCSAALPMYSTPCKCPPGYLCPGGNSRPDAVPCPAGMVCPDASAFPSGGCAPGYFCPEGSVNVIGTSVLKKQGGRCGPGSYCPAGSPEPILCPPGTFSSISGRFLPCDQCPQGFWSALSNQTTNATCRQCPPGTTTSGPGATSRDACAALPYTCPAGQQPIRLPATTLADCGPLTCAGGLQLAASGVGCEGCPPGTSGRPPQCSRCNASMHVCPGLTSFPLPSLSVLSSALMSIRNSRGANVPASVSVAAPGSRMLSTASDCAALADAASPYWPSNAAAPAKGGASNLAGEALIGVVAGTLGSLVLFFGYLAMKTPPDADPSLSPNPGSNTGAAAIVQSKPGPKGKTPPLSGGSEGGWRHKAGIRMRKITMAVDQFALVHKIDRRSSPILEPTPLGGTCSLLGIVTLLAIWAILILQRAENNVGRTVSIDAAGEEQLVLAASSQRGSNTNGLSGIHVIIAAAGEPGTGGCSTIVSWKATGLYNGAFTHSVTSCGAVAQHIFACPDCVVTAGSAIEAVLPWSCQAVVVQTVAASVDGQLTIRTADASAPIPDASGGSTTEVQLLSSVAVAVPPMLLLQNDTMQKGFPITRGYRLLAGSASRSMRTVSVDTFTPSTATVRISVDLEPSGIFQGIQLFERITLAQLLSSLLGTLGLLGAFGAIAKQIERPLLKMLPHSGFNPQGMPPNAPADGFVGQAALQRPVGAASASANGRDSLWTVKSPLAKPRTPGGPAASDGPLSDESEEVPGLVPDAGGAREQRGSYAPAMARNAPRAGAQQSDRV